jgi:hypothetical protein
MPFIGNKPTAVPLTSADIQDGTIALADLSATGTKDATTFLRGDNTFASAGGENTPYFYATLSADQTGLTNDTETKLTLATEIFDTGSEFDNVTNYRFTPANGNTYLVSGLVQLKASAAAVLQEARLQFKKNGSTIVEINQNTYNNNSTQMAPTFQYIITGNGSDYYELFGRAYVSSGTPTIGQRSFFTAFKLIG